MCDGETLRLHDITTRSITCGQLCEKWQNRIRKFVCQMSTANFKKKVTIAVTGDYDIDHATIFSNLTKKGKKKKKIRFRSVFS